MTRTVYEPRRRRRRAAALVAPLAVAAAAAVAGCASPMDRTAEEALRERIVNARREYLGRNPTAGELITISREPSDVEEQLSDERREELEAMSGIRGYRDEPLRLGDDLLGVPFDESRTVELTLEEAIRKAVAFNLDVAVARFLPAIAFEDVVQAEAVFDGEFFADVTYQNLDTPQPPPAAVGIAGLSGDLAIQDVLLETGIRKPLSSGGLVTFQTNPRFQQQTPTFNAFDNFYTASVSATISQPLLEGFGRRVNRANIRVARNATLAERQELRLALLTVVADVHEAYWNLFAAEANLLIQQRLLERTLADRDRLIERKDFDASPVQITESNSSVEERRLDVIQARQSLRLASDAIKNLINDPDLPVAGETLVLPSDPPSLDAISFNLVELVSQGLRRRPEMEQALLAITDASILIEVAENALLPELDVFFTLSLNGLDETRLDDVYTDDIFELNFIDYIVGASFTQSLGNRSDRAAFDQSVLQRDQAVTAYERQAKLTVLDVKTALRDLITSFQLIGAARASRLAAADALRAIEAQEEAGVPLTPEFLLDLKLQAQERLADAEVAEVQAIADYNSAIAALFEATGTLLERHEFEVEDPEPWPRRVWWRDLD